MAEATVARALVAVGMSCLEATQLVEMAVLVVDATASQLVPRGARCMGVVLVCSTPGCDALQPVSAGRLAPTGVDCEIAPAEAHVASPLIAIREGFLKSRPGVEVAVVVVNTTTSHRVATIDPNFQYATASEPP